jgi:PAS domain S-box-containing protein
LTLDHKFAECVINTVRKPLVLLDQDLRVLSTSRSFYRTFKVTPEETLGRLIYELGNNQWDIPSLRELLEAILPEKLSFDDYEVEHNFTTIGHRHMLLNARQIEQAMGKERIILLAIEDVTRRREIEVRREKVHDELLVIKNAADTARDFAECIINTVREPLISLDQNLRVVTVSRSFYDFFKVTPEETRGKLIYELGNNQWDIPKLRELLEDILPEKTSFDGYEVEHDFATIGYRHMLLNARQVEQVISKQRIILLAIEDITDRKQIEDELEMAIQELSEKNAELETRNAELERFTYTVSHDLKSPLITIQGFSGVLEQRLGANTEPDVRKSLDFINSAIKKMYELLEDLLELSRCGQTAKPTESVSLAEITREALTLVEDRLVNKPITITVADDLPQVTGDHIRLREVLQNLLENAIKYMGDQTKPHIEIGIAEIDRQLACFVRDNGIGISPEYHKNVFGLFKRLGQGDEGTGIGLAIVKRIIELHGGRIWIESTGNPGAGATFWFTLPWENPAPKPG